MTARKLLMLIATTGLSILLSACDDQPTSSSSPATTVLQKSTSIPNGRLVIRNPENSKQLLPLRGINYSTGRNGKTNKNGSFPFKGAGAVSFTLFGKTLGPMPVKKTYTQNDLTKYLCADAPRKGRCLYVAQKNLQRLLLSVDNDQDRSNGIYIPAKFNRKMAFEFDSSIDAYELALGKYLNRHGRQPAMLFKPSLAINLESVQPENDNVGGQPLAFADLFRVSRPFPEFSCTLIEYDGGWPVNIPTACSNEKNHIIGKASYATAVMLPNVPLDSLPLGRYIVLYDGNGVIEYGGIGAKVNSASVDNRHVVIINKNRIKKYGSKGFQLTIKQTDPNLPVKNIRVIMPGGTCEYNPFVRVGAAGACKARAFTSFESQLKHDRNTIVFNPDYLRFLKDFKLFRAMNLLEASPRNHCFMFTTEAEYKECLLQDFTWDMRAKMDDPSWGGSFWTPALERYARGAPLEVAIELANQLSRDIWLTIPHNATNDYVRRYATYVRDHLKPDLKAHIEYTNEAWNSQFWATLYVREKGKDLHTNPFWGGAYYYATRASEIFTIWQEVFGGTEQLVRVLGSYSANEWLSRNMLNYNGTAQNVDVLAVAPYFYGCWNRSSHPECADTEKNPLTVAEAKSVSDLFAIIDNPGNRYGLEAKIAEIATQAKVAADFNVDLYAYEAGQHLTINWTNDANRDGVDDDGLSQADKQKLLELIRKANRSSKMSVRYKRFLEGWKNQGGQLMALYTLPQTYHPYGTFGIKETLNQSRYKAPKYDRAMRFQEALGSCWWESCE